MIKAIKRKIQIIESYLWGVKLAEYESKLNGKLELWLINNRKVLNTANANLSFDSLHRIFQEVFSQINIKLKKPETALLLGLGCGSVPTILFNELKLNCHLIAVEYDPMMIDIAMKHFDLQKFQNMTILIDDASNYVDHSIQKFDLIVVDLFTDNEVPDKFTEFEFIEKSLSLLCKSGILVFNMMTENLHQQQRFNQLMAHFTNAEIIKLFGTNSILVFRNN